ncbi:MAG: PP2C family protein-serine/threonine phosphatase [Acidobacteriota bacterium]
MAQYRGRRKKTFASVLGLSLAKTRPVRYPWVSLCSPQIPKAKAPTPEEALSKSWAWLLLCLSSIVCAQSTIIPASQCVWHAGDDPAWAKPGLDESGWKPYAQWNFSFDQPRLWIRCKADLAAMRGLSAPAIQVSAPAAYEVYFDGRLVGRLGSLRTGNFSMDRTRTWDVPREPEAGSGIVAVRLAYRTISDQGSASIRLGSRADLSAIRDSIVLAGIQADAGMFVCYTVIGVIGLALLGLFLSDRSRMEVLLLALSCLLIALLRLCVFALHAEIGVSALADDLVFSAADSIFFPAQICFFFRLARRRMPAFILIPLVPTVLWTTLLAAATLAPYAVAVRINGLLSGPYVYAGSLLVMAAIDVVSAVIAFLPLRSLSRDARMLAAFCWLWALTDLVWFALETSQAIPGMPDLFDRWYTQLAEARGVALLCIVVALMALLLREQRRVVEDRAQLAGEMHAARNAQQFLISRHLPQIPGLTIQSEYHPSREVGGDFFQVLPLPDEAALVVVGDVAGKGMEAGMLAALIVGAVRTAATFTSDPKRILSLLNDRLQGRGLVTCLALRIESDGSATLVNAGHLPPLLNGNELPIEGSLPLGAAPGISFPVLQFQVSEGDALVLMTDGVVEAQNSEGELFGFDRISRLLRGGTDGAALAHAAQQFGQKDDITVLTLQYTPAQVLHP